MFVALLFLLSSLYSGFVAAKKLGILDTEIKRLSIGFLAGFVLQSAFLLALSWLSGGLEEQWILLSSVVFVLAAFAFDRRFAVARLRERRLPFVSNADRIALAFSLLFLALNFLAILHPTQTGFESVASVWGDYPLHLSIANSFALRDNFPPQYPVLLGEPLKYSFLFDFSSAILLKGGFDFRSAFLVPNALVFVAFALALVLLCELFAGSKGRVLFVFLAFALFFFNGNYGMAGALEDAFSQGSLSPLLHPDRNYSNADDKGVVVMNWVYSILMPARSALLGLAISVFTYAVLFSSVLNSRWNRRELFAAGVLAGLLPLAHAHSLVVVGAVAGFLFLFSVRKWKEWVFFAGPAAVIALPQLAWLSSKVFFKIFPGWLSPEKSFLGVAEFWVKNGWAVLLCFAAWLAFALKSNDWKRLALAAPFALVFVLANLFVLQPWEWDNTKFFMQFFLFACIASALFLESLWTAQGKQRILHKAVVVVIVLLGVASGVLAILWTGWGDNARYETFSKEDVALAAWITVNTPSGALFLSSTFHHNPVPALAGRQIVAGYEGWLWSHGLNYQKTLQDAKKMFEEADCRLMGEYGVDFVLVRKTWEDAALYEGKGFERVYSDRRGNMVFKSNCIA
ncbi:MAG: hypothetical protein QXR53_01205 [Candidatus Norongarragalinales archaeon]